MSLFDPNVPTGLVKLNSDYKNVQNNMQQLDTSFGIDHYLFSDQTANNGFHNHVTLPLIVGSAHPSTNAAQTSVYCMQDYAATGLLDYSRGPSNAVPTPITCLQSPSTPITLANNASTNILDASGLTMLIGVVYCFDAVKANTTKLNGVTWKGASWSLSPDLYANTNTIFVISGNILTLKNTSGGVLSNVYWTLEIKRIQ